MSAMIISSQPLYLTNKASESRKSCQNMFLEVFCEHNKVITAAVSHDHFVTTTLSQELVIWDLKFMTEKCVEFNWSVNKASTTAVSHDHFIYHLRNLFIQVQNWKEVYGARQLSGIPPMEVVAEISAHFSSFILVSPSEVHLFLWIQIAHGGPVHRGGLAQFKHITKHINLFLKT